MANTLSIPQISSAVTATLSGGGAPATNQAVINDPTAVAFVVGTNQNQVNLCYSASGTVTSGTPFSLNLNNGTALDPLSGILNFGHVCDIKLTNLSVASGQDLTLGGGGTNGLFAALPTLCRATNGGCIHITDPVGIVVGTGGTNQVQITVAAGTAVPFYLTILGRTT